MSTLSSDEDINPLIAQFESKPFQHFFASQMEHETLATLAKKLSDWKSEKLVGQNRAEIEEFAYFWATRLLSTTKPAFSDKFAAPKYGYLLVLLGIAELEYQIHQELVSRQLGYRTYKEDDIFEFERIKRLNPNLLRTSLNYDGLGVVAEGDLSGVMASIERWLDEKLES
ncbi:hypothetical protein [Noviherbaspirillum aerium]|uniref:hypothetical protein n=1 Tax=Noviherbaspirillum aerium TaxID=2588497 RepID=UPI00124CBD32|nr:hypothetical protein [Noviherbaspirillum aerium]